MVTYISKSPDDTQRLGIEWGRAAAVGWLVGLVGDLGAGKTQLVKGIALGLGIEDRILSPTFTLVHEYETGRLPLCHIDLYRLNSPSQISSAGLDDYLFAPRGLTVVEWIDRWYGADGPPGLSPVEGGQPVLMPAQRYRHVQFRLLGDTERQITYEDFGR